MTMSSQVQDTGSLWVGVAAAAVGAAAFVLLTVNTGTTYHLFPLVIAAAPGVIPRLVFDRPLDARQGTLATLLGLAAVAVAWGALELLEEMPSATLLSDQPGGVRGEFAVFGVLGALAGSWWGSQR
jgi:hypothetical protein